MLVIILHFSIEAGGSRVSGLLERFRIDTVAMQQQRAVSAEYG